MPLTLRRFFATAATFAALTGPSFAQGLSEMEERSAIIAERYLAVWSSSGDLSIEGVPYIYGPRVRFYGRSLDWSG